MRGISRLLAAMLAGGVVFVAGACASDARSDVVVAAAADTRDAFNEIAAQLSERDGITVEFVFGSSGLLREQVLNGAPFDVYVSANVAFVDEVVQAGAGVAESQRQFAVGRLALISADGVALPANLDSLSQFGRVVIANPAHAPYGVAAKEALQSLGDFGQLASRLILADNVADAVRIVDAGEAEVGIVALSLVIGRAHVAVPATLHQPIRQSIVITTRGAGNDAAHRFVEALESQEGRAVLSRYGFTVDSP
ncbi:MAG: molybdate ABC transporter substrate-binding protein [Actinomycetota bacterium]